MKIIFMSLVLLGLIAACTTANDVKIQVAHSEARAQECAAVGRIADAGAPSEAAVLMAARGCGSGPAPRTSADQVAGIIGAVAPIAGAVINGAVGIHQSKTSADVQLANVAAGTVRAGIDADVLTVLGRDQVVTVRPEVVAPEVVVSAPPEVVQLPAPVVVQLPAADVIQAPAAQICAMDASGALVCQ